MVWNRRDISAGTEKQKNESKRIYKHISSNVTGLKVAFLNFMYLIYCFLITELKDFFILTP